jgi:Mce-associated membrane protein
MARTTFTRHHAQMEQLPVTESASAPSTSPGTPPPDRRRGRARVAGVRRPRAVPVLVVALVLALLLAGWLALKVRHHDQLDSARRSAVATAQSYAVDLTTYDHAHLDADFNKVLSNSTGSFRAQYTEASQTLRDLIARFQATATGKVLETAVLSADTKHATLLLFVDQTVTNTNSKDPRVDRSRMKMSLEKHGGRWLISALDLL